jgi:hypothetical protein
LTTREQIVARIETAGPDQADLELAQAEVVAWLEGNPDDYGVGMMAESLVMSLTGFAAYRGRPQII